MTASLSRQLSLDEAGEGRFTTDLDEAWNCPLVPHGGVVTAVAARAMERTLGLPDQRLRSITSVFAGPVRAGPAVVDVQVVRKGRSVSQLTATLRNDGEPAGLTATAVFGASRRGFTFTDLERPDVPPPEESPSFRDDPPPGYDEGPHFNFWDHAQGRAAVGHAPWDDYEPGTSERVYWYRLDDPPVRDDGTLDPLVLVVFADTMPGAVREKMGPGTPNFLPPSADLTVHLFGDIPAGWILARNRARHASDGYASADMELWDPSGDLVAYATQMMIFSFPTG